ncbi:hypothetical protein [Peribacillus sp. SCS-155]
MQAYEVQAVQQLELLEGGMQMKKQPAKRVQCILNYKLSNQIGGC